MIVSILIANYSPLVHNFTGWCSNQFKSPLEAPECPLSTQPGKMRVLKHVEWWLFLMHRPNFFEITSVWHDLQMWRNAAISRSTFIRCNILSPRPRARASTGGNRICKTMHRKSVQISTHFSIISKRHLYPSQLSSAFPLYTVVKSSRHVSVSFIFSSCQLRTFLNKCPGCTLDWYWFYNNYCYVICRFG